MKPLFKYTVTLTGNDDVSFASDDRYEIQSWLLEDSRIQDAGMKEYLENVEGPYVPEDCEDYIFDNLEELAHQCGYVIMKEGE